MDFLISAIFNILKGFLLPTFAIFLVNKKLFRLFGIISECLSLMGGWGEQFGQHEDNEFFLLLLRFSKWQYKGIELIKLNFCVLSRIYCCKCIMGNNWLEWKNMYLQARYILQLQLVLMFLFTFFWNFDRQTVFLLSRIQGVFWTVQKLSKNI